MAPNVAAVTAYNAMANGTVNTSTTGATTVTISAADPTNPRIDAVVYIPSTAAWAVRAGTPAAASATAGPVMPNINATDLLMAEVYVGAGVTSIVTANITDRRQRLATSARQGTNITSASALNLTQGDYFQVTGTVTVTSISTRPAGNEVTLYFSGALTLTHNATNLILRGATNYTTTAGDVFKLRSEGSGNWREVGRLTAASLGAMTLVASNTAEQGTTVDAKTTLVTLTPAVALPTTSLLLLVINCRKTAGAAFAASVGLTINSTDVLSPGTNNLWASSGTNQAEDGAVVTWIPPRSANYLNTQISSTLMSRVSASGANANNVMGLTSLTTSYPSASITSIVITGKSGSVSQTVSVKDCFLYSLVVA